MQTEETETPTLEQFAALVEEFKPEFVSLLAALKKDIGEEYRCTDDPEDTEPGMTVTLSTTDGSNWSYQTGDNSYTGGCYGHAHWAVLSLYHDSDVIALADEAIDELCELYSGSI